MKIFELRGIATEDLQRRLKEEIESLENLRFQKAIGQLENFKAIQNTKRLIARINTILKERIKAVPVKQDEAKSLTNDKKDIQQ